LRLATREHRLPVLAPMPVPVSVPVPVPMQLRLQVLPGR